jgi:2-iminobutanoate/2-iminopropanoate deaminase
MERTEHDLGRSSPLSAAVVAEGRFVYVSGQGALVDGVYQPGDTATETRLALANLEEALETAGSARELVVRCGVFLADIADLEAMNSAYTDFFAPSRPARTTVQAGALPGGIRVEIDCVALVR